MANILSTAKRVAVVAALSEGNSIRSTVRLTGVAKNTVTKLLVDLGTASSRFQDAMLVNLPIQRLQVDEIWSFCQMKEATAVLQGREDEWGIGHVWTFTAIDPETKLVPAWMVGCRDSDFAAEFLADVQSRIVSRIQLTTDGHKMYFEAVEAVFRGDVDYAQVKKTFGKSTLNRDEFERRYSPTGVKAIDVQVIEGFPEPEHISTSINERNNLNIRMNLRRFTRLTNAFSKKIENLAAAVSLHFMVHNFVRPHGTLTKKADGVKTTPAMAIGVAEKPWSYEEVVGLLG